MITTKTNFIESLTEEQIAQLIKIMNKLHSQLLLLVNNYNHININNQLIEDIIPQKSIIIKEYESVHPYNPNMDEYIEVNIPNVTSVTVTFDSQSRTENSCDYVQFLSLDKVSLHPAVTSYSGRDGTQNWPGCEGRPELVLDSNNFLIFFHSDGSVQGMYVS